MAASFPLRILSDLHLAHPASLVKNVWQLEPLLEGVKTVVFNGDTTEWRLREGRATADRYLQTLQQLCADRGVEPIFISGNHDPVGGEDALEFLDGRLLVTHGDVLFPEVTPWGRDAPELRERHRRILQELGGEERPTWEQLLRACKSASMETDPLSGRMHESKRAWLSGVLQQTSNPLRVWQVLCAWVTAPQRAAALLSEHRPRVRWMVVGHTHLPGRWRRGERTILNTGAYLPGFGRRVVDVSLDSVSMNRVESSGKFFRLGKRVFREPIRLAE